MKKYLHIFHKWQNWQDITANNFYAGITYKQTRVCSICNKRQVRKIV